MTEDRALWVSLRDLSIAPLYDDSAGGHGVAGPGSVWWRLMGERALLIGGPCALLMQVAHPAVAAAVVDHTNLRTSLISRLNVTMTTLLHVTFGNSVESRAVLANLSRRHAKVRGEYARGPYSALDPQLIEWVHSALAWTALRVYTELVGTLSPTERDRYVAEAGLIGELFGVRISHWPVGFAAFSRHVDTMVHDVLEVGTDARHIADTLLGIEYYEAPIIGRYLVRAATTALLPGRLPKSYGLEPARTEAFMIATGAAMSRLALAATPRLVRRWPHERAAQRRPTVS